MRNRTNRRQAGQAIPSTTARKGVMTRALLTVVAVLVVGAAQATVIDTTPDLIWHLDATLGVATNAGGYVSAWANQSGTGGNFTQSDASRQPLFVVASPFFNDLPVIRFTGELDPSGSRLDATGGDWVRSVFLVIKPSSSGFWNSLVLTRLIGGTGYYQNSVGVLYGTTWNAAVNSGTPSYYVNGVAGNVQTADSVVIAEVYGNIFMNEASLGSCNTSLKGLTGDVAEMAVYNRTLTSEERTAIFDYLQQKYARPCPIDRITGVVLHMDAAQGVTMDASSNVSAWADQAFGVSAFSQSTAGQQPRYVASVPAFKHQPVIRFNGTYTNFLLNSTSLTAASLIFVCNSGPGYLNELWGPHAASGIKGLRRDDTHWRAYGYTSGSVVTMIVNQATMVTGTTDSADLSVDALANSPAILEVYGDIAGFTPALGWCYTPLASRAWSGDIAEMAAFDHILTLEERTTAVNYLAQKYFSGQNVIDTTSNLFLHLDAALNVTMDASSNVSAWADQSGTYLDFSQTNSVRQPLYVASSSDFYNRPVIRFDGADPAGDMLTAIGGDTARSVFIVCKTTPEKALGGIFGRGGYHSGLRRSSGGGSWEGDTLTSPTIYVNGKVGSAAAAGAPVILEVYVADNSFWAGYPGIGNFYYDTSRSWAGDIAEMAVYNRVLTAGERAAIFDYLQGKYLPIHGTTFSIH